MSTLRLRIDLTIPILTVSEANRHEHWRKRQKRAQGQRAETKWRVRQALSPIFRKPWTLGPLVVIMRRVTGRQLDTDNLAGAMKHIRDGIADALGRDDGPEESIEWRVYQHKRLKSDPKYAVKVSIYSVEESE